MAETEALHSDPGRLVEYLREKIAQLDPEETFWLGIAGPPGSGKSTLGRLLVEQLGEIALVVPMDGFHFYRADLDKMDDPAEAHRRRRAPFTFDVKRFVESITSARESGAGNFPSFDHGTGDPVEDDIHLISGRHRIVILEGNYLLLDEVPWNQIRTLLDETWYLDVEIELCMQRVRERFLATGRDEATAEFRVKTNDRPNAELVARVGRANADWVIEG